MVGVEQDLLLRDLGVAEAFQFPHRHLAQFGFPQPAEQAFQFLGQQGGLLRRRLVARQTIEAGRAAVASRAEGRVPANVAAPALVACVVFDEVGRLAGREDDQQRPQAVAVLQVGELSLFGPTAEAVEGAEGGVLLVGDPAQRGLQFLAHRPTRRG